MAENNVIKYLDLEGLKALYGVVDGKIQVETNRATTAETALSEKIAAMDLTDTAEGGKFVTAVHQTDGKVTIERGGVSASMVTATNVVGGAGTVAITGATVEDQIKNLGQTLKTVEGNAAKYKVVKLSDKEVADLGDANVKEAYKVVSYVGAETGSTVYTKVGEVIKIYKDANLESAELGTGENAQKLILTYILADGTRKPVPIDFKAIAFESEFKDGLAVAPNGEISVKIDATSEDLLTVGADGVKLDGVYNAINTVFDKSSILTNERISEEIAKLDVSDIGEEGKFITKVSEVDGKIAAEFAQVKANEVKLEQIEDAGNSSIKLNATTVQEGIAELFTKILDNEEVDAKAINKIKIILGITGEELKYEAKSDDTIIGAATSYSDADIKLVEAIRTTQGNAITIQPGNGVNITSNGSVKTINVKVVNDDKLITVDNSGIHTKDNAVFDCGTY